MGGRRAVEGKQYTDDSSKCLRRERIHSETKCHRKNPFSIVQWFILFKFTPSTVPHPTKISPGYRANALFVADFSSFNLPMTICDSDTTF